CAAASLRSPAKIRRGSAWSTAAGPRKTCIARSSRRAPRGSGSTSIEMSPASEANEILRFAEILGQGPVLAMLREAIAAGTLHHALLFVGPEGVGKRTTARALAARLLCTSPSEEEACGRCAACRQVTVGSHPDFHREALLALDPESKRKELRSEMLLEQAH